MNKLIKNFRELGAKEFFKRWGQGIQKVSPGEQNKIQMFGTVITIVGILCGLLMSLLYFSKFWWGSIILLGALINTGVTLLGQYQKYKLFSQLEISIKEVEDDKPKSTN